MLEPSQNDQLPPIPGKRYFGIGEVSELCGVRPHVLRYWEQEFPELTPAKRTGNRRYYQRQDVLVIRQIRGLLYEEGYTIGGARLRIETEKQASAALARSGPTASAADAPADAQLLASIREELEALLELLRR